MPAEASPESLPEAPAVSQRALLLAKARKKRRLDEVCAERFPQHSRNVVQSWIALGKVTVNERVVVKAGAPVAPDASIVINAEVPKFVCRAGLKLEAALDHWALDVRGLRCLDAGVSTGGFTDCLLQRGAAHVVGVDVGYGQVAERVRTDTRVALLERTNLRYLNPGQLPEGCLVDLVTLDLSFISVLKVLPAVCGVLAPAGALLVLIKPQFEAGRAQVGGGGIAVGTPAGEQAMVKFKSMLDATTQMYRLAALGHMPAPAWLPAWQSTKYLQSLKKRAPGPKPIEFPEDRLIQSFFARHPNAKDYEPVRLDSFEPPLSRRYAFQQLELMEAGMPRRKAQRVVDAWFADEIKAQERRSTIELVQRNEEFVLMAALKKHREEKAAIERDPSLGAMMLGL
ncbi:hypothetical protein WJX81_003681 [Elliptochloris bilobata]|uniref:Small ribosomal subunit protein mS23 n=1 Tax=Elliptochloris bilobata TaxID=381761 RepID=A0AAW1RQQ8_9CHLO